MKSARLKSGYLTGGSLAEEHLNSVENEMTKWSQEFERGDSICYYDVLGIVYVF